MTSGLYQHKLDLFQRLGGLSEEMAALSVDQLLNDDQAFARLQRLMQEREEVMAEIDQVTAQIETGKSIVLDEEMESLLRHKAEAVKKNNEAIENTVKAVLAGLRERAKKLREGKQSQRAYAGRISSAEGSFIDKRR